MSQTRVMAEMVRSLDATGIRVGSPEYRRDNGSYGLTTLSHWHATVRGKVVQFDFHGKGGIRHRLEVKDAQLARVVRDCLKRPGKVLFQYVGDQGVRPASAEEVNRYLSEASSGAVTAKDFRMWHASVCVAAELAAAPSDASKRLSTRTCKLAIAKAAGLLGNTVTVCRKFYVHTGVVDAYCNGEFARLMKGFAPKRRKWLSRGEQLLLHILEQLCD
jgi:DNA topoisomerase-1